MWRNQQNNKDVEKQALSSNGGEHVNVYSLGGQNFSICDKLETEVADIHVT